MCDDLQELIDAGAYQDCDLEELDKKAEENRVKIMKKLDKYASANAHAQPRRTSQPASALVHVVP